RSGRRARRDGGRSAGVSLLSGRATPAGVGHSLRREHPALRDLHRLQGRSRPRRDAAAFEKVAMTERWTFAAGYAPDAIAGAIVVVAATVAIVEGMIAFRRRRSGATRRRAFGILALRVLAVAALMALAFEITLRIDQVTPQGHKLVVLVDRSASMGVPDALEDGPTETRQARAERAWAASADARQ